MNQTFQKFLLIVMQLSIGKNISINSKTGFRNLKPDFGFKTENRKSGFLLTSLVFTAAEAPRFNELGHSEIR